MDDKLKAFGFTQWKVTDTMKTDKEIISFLEVCEEEDDDGTLLLRAIDRIAREKDMALIDAMVKYGVSAKLNRHHQPVSVHA